MNRLFVLLFLFSFFSLACINADDLDKQKVSTTKAVSLLLDDGFYKNEEQIKTLATELTLEQKQFLFDRYEKPAISPFVMNLILGFGVGSYVQGDFLGGAIGTAGDILIGGPFLLMCASSGDEGEVHALFGLAYVGLRVFQCVKPFSYAKKYNNRLTDALGFYDLSYGVMPSVNRDGEFGVKFVCSLKL